MHPKKRAGRLASGVYPNPDGWANVSGLWYGEDKNNDGIWNQTTEPDPLNPDTDGDRVPDGCEYFYVNDSGNQTKFNDTDGDNVIDILDYDSDSDGLSDGEENWDFDAVLDKGNLTDYTGEIINDCRFESDPTDPDCDGDGLLDGAEPLPFVDLDRDGRINVWDYDSNMIPNSTSDYDDVYVIFRTNATDENTYYNTSYGDHSQGDGYRDNILDYRKDTWIVIFWYDEIYLYDDGYYDSNQTGRENVTNSSAYSYNGTSTSVDVNKLNRTRLIWNETPDEMDENIPMIGDEEIYGKYVNLTSADGFPVYTYDSNDNGDYNSNDDIVINVTNVTGTYYHFYKPDTTSFVFDYLTNNHSLPNLPADFTYPIQDNFVVNHQERYDPRIATHMDLDFDGIDNSAEMLAGTNPYDADTDNDGVPDGLEVDWNFDTDGDGGSTYWTTKLDTEGDPIVIKYFNSTNALDPDSDDDNLNDSLEMGITTHVFRNGVDHTENNIGIEYNPSSSRWEDTNIDWYDDGTYWCPPYVNSWYNKSHFDSDEDPTTKTDMCNDDTDFDDMNDGVEDDDKDGVWDSDEANPLDADTDDDGVLDGDDGTGDADSDGIKDCLEYDADNDTLYDGLELGKTMPISDNVNNDNTFTFILNGTDLSKGYFIMDEDPTVTTSHTDDDTDDDGLYDGIEDLNKNGVFDEGETNPNEKDTDSDGLADGWIDQKVWNSTAQVFDDCTEGDEGLFEPWEGEDYNNDGQVNLDDENNSLETDPLNKDSDGDMLGDGDETYPTKIKEDDVQNPNNNKSDPLKTDTDGDGLTDYLEVTGWNITIIWEATLEVVKGPYYEYSYPDDNDTDNDGLWDLEEYTHSSDPTMSDSDGDNVNDKTEVDLGSDPVGMDGIPPILSDLICWVDPIVEKGSNGVPYLSGILIKITVDATDPTCVHYIELEIENNIERIYIQETQEQTIITDATINISMDYPYGEQEPLIVRVVDFCGNINESEWKPIPYWYNFKEQHWADPYQNMKENKTRSGWSSSGIDLSDKYTKEIVRNLRTALADQKITIMDKYEATLNKKNAFNLRDFYIHGINLKLLIDCIQLGNYSLIKYTFLSMGMVYSGFGDPFKEGLTFYNDLLKVSNDFNKLERASNITILENMILELEQYLGSIIDDFENDKDGNGVPYILEAGYGLKSNLKSLYDGNDDDIDNDGISNYDEIKVIFRSSLNHNDYSSGWVAVDIGAKMLVACGFSHYTSTDDPSMIVRSFVSGKRGITPEGYEYIVDQTDSENCCVFIYLNKCNSGEQVIAVFSQNSFNSTVYPEADFSSLTNGRYYFSHETKLCPDANPIIQDVFLEVDWMAGVITKSTSVEVTINYFYIYYKTYIDTYTVSKYVEYNLDSTVKKDVIKKYADQYINLHIDDGSIGGGGAIPIYDETIPLNVIYSFYFNPYRQNIFKYCIITNNRNPQQFQPNAFSIKRDFLPGNKFVNLFTRNILHNCNFIDRNLDNDSDNDGLPNEWEKVLGTDPENAKSIDKIGFRIIDIHSDKLVTCIEHLSADELNYFSNDDVSIANIAPEEKILYPTLGSPAIVKKGETFGVHIKETTEFELWTVELIPSFDISKKITIGKDMSSIIDSNNTNVNARYLNIDTSNVPSGLYDLKVYNDIETHVSSHSVKVIDDYNDNITIVQISDIHIGYGTGNNLNVDRLMAVITRVNEFINPDFVVITGDLTDNGYELEMEYLKASLLNCRYPVFCIPGNHDHQDSGETNKVGCKYYRKYISPVFFNDAHESTDNEENEDDPDDDDNKAKHCAGLDYALDYNNFHFIVFDSGPLVGGHTETNGLSDDQLAWIQYRQGLYSGAGNYTFIFTHSPFTGHDENGKFSHDQNDYEFIDWANGEKENDASDDKIEAVFCGHTHEPWIFGEEVTKYDYDGDDLIFQDGDWIGHWVKFDFYKESKKIWYIETEDLKG